MLSQSLKLQRGKSNRAALKIVTGIFSREINECVLKLYCNTAMSIGITFSLIGFEGSHLLFSMSKPKDLHRIINTFYYSLLFRSSTSCISRTNLTLYAGIFNILGLPVTQCPLGLSVEGLPLGLQLVAGKLQDHLSLATALYLEKAFGGWREPGDTEHAVNSTSNSVSNAT